MEQRGARGRRFAPYWLFNILLGIPTPYVFIWLIFHYYGFMVPAQPQEKVWAIAVFAVYAGIWFFGNYRCLRKEDIGTRIGLHALSPLVIGASAYISYKGVHLLLQFLL